MKKRALFLILVLALFLCLLPTYATATETSGSCGDDLTWSFDTSTGVLTIEGSGAMRDYISTRPWGAYQGSIKHPSGPCPSCYYVRPGVPLSEALGI